MKRFSWLVAVLLVVILVVLAVVRWQPEAKVEKKKSLTFDQLVFEITKRDWHIVEQSNAGENAEIMVVFSDAHVPSIEELNFQRVLELEEFFDLEVVNLENIADTPDSEQSKRMHRSPQEAIKIDKDKILILKTNGSQELERLPESSRIAEKHFKNPNFEAYGFEDPELFANIAPVALGEDVYDIMLEVVMRKAFMPVEKEGKQIYQVMELISAQEYLNRYRPGYPIFEPSKLKMRKHGAIILSHEDESYVAELAIQHRAWAIKYSIHPRNENAVKRSVTRMRGKGQKRAAMVIGADHNRHHQLIEGKTVAEYLKEQGVSYIVVSEF